MKGHIRDRAAGLFTLTVELGDSATTKGRLKLAQSSVAPSGRQVLPLIVATQALGGAKRKLPNGKVD